MSNINRQTPPVARSSSTCTTSNATVAPPPTTPSKERRRTSSRRTPTRVTLSPQQLKRAMLGEDMPPSRSPTRSYGEQSVDLSPRTRDSDLSPRSRGEESMEGGREVVPSQYSQVRLSKDSWRSGLATQGSAHIRRAEGMFDLSNIHTGSECAEHRSSILNLYEEFQRQCDAVQNPVGLQHRRIQPQPQSTSQNLSSATANARSSLPSPQQKPTAAATKGKSYHVVIV